MNYLCPVCGRAVDQEGFPVATPQDYSPTRFIACIGHRLQAAQERFTTRLAKQKKEGGWPEKKVEVRLPYRDE